MLKFLKQLLGNEQGQFSEETIAEHAAQISKEGDRAAEAIRERLNGIPSGQSLFILLGEDHTVVSHIVHHIYVLEQLRKDGISFGVALEYPSNALESYAIRELQVPPEHARSTARTAIASNPTAHRLLYAAAFLAETPFAPHSTATLVHYLEKHQIPICLADAAADQDGYLDRTDYETESALLEAQVQLATLADGPVAFDDKLGMVARNIHMERAAFKFAELLNQPRVIFCIVGNAHVLGT